MFSRQKLVPPPSSSPLSRTSSEIRALYSISSDPRKVFLPPVELSSSWGRIDTMEIPDFTMFSISDLYSHYASVSPIKRLARRAGGFKRTKTIPPVHPASKNQIYVRYASLKNRRDFLWPRRITSSRWLVLKVRLTKAGQWVGRLEMNRRSWLGVAKATIVLCSHWNRKQYPINDVIDAVIVNDFVLALLIRPIMWGTFIAKLTHKLSYLKSILALHKVDMRGRQTAVAGGLCNSNYKNTEGLIWCHGGAGRNPDLLRYFAGGEAGRPGGLILLISTSESSG